jgi:DNA-binding PadR family transcriptional regulator
MHNFSYIELAILQMLESQNLHGYAMSHRMHHFSAGNLDLPAGSLYPALHKLEKNGFITSSVEHVNGRKRKIYSLTPDGADELDAQAEAWQIISLTMNRLLGFGDR